MSSKKKRNPAYIDSDYDYQRRITVTSQSDAERKHQNKFPSISQSFTDLVIQADVKEDYDYKRTLSRHGYIIIKEIANTLQGFIFEAKDIETNEIVIVKMAEIALFKRKKSRCGASVQENIFQEMKLIKDIQRKCSSKSFVKFIESFQDSKYFFAIMEHGGQGFFDYVVTSHQRIENNEISKDEWKKHLKVLFKQIVKLISWLHNECFVCHLDISLENMVIKGVKYDYKENKFIKHGRLSLIDYGLAERFKPRNFSCKKYVGKTGYCCPNIWNQNKFDARKADVYSLSICFFMAYIGAPPYKKPSIKKDKAFRLIYNNEYGLHKLLKHWKRSKWMPKEIRKIIKQIWVHEDERIYIEDILCNPYFNKPRKDSIPQKLIPLSSIKTNSNISVISNNSISRDSRLSYISVTSSQTSVVSDVSIPILHNNCSFNSSYNSNNNSNNNNGLPLILHEDKSSNCIVTKKHTRKSINNDNSVNKKYIKYSNPNKSNNNKSNKKHSKMKFGLLFRK